METKTVKRKKSGRKKVRFVVSPYSQPLPAINKTFTTKNTLKCETLRGRTVRAMQGNITLTVVRSRASTGCDVIVYIPKRSNFVYKHVNNIDFVCYFREAAWRSGEGHVCAWLWWNLQRTECLQPRLLQRIPTQSLPAK